MSCWIFYLFYWFVGNPNVQLMGCLPAYLWRTLSGSPQCTSPTVTSTGKSNRWLWQAL